MTGSSNPPEVFDGTRDHWGRPASIKQTGSVSWFSLCTNLVGHGIMFNGCVFELWGDSWRTQFTLGLEADDVHAAARLKIPQLSTNIMQTPASHMTSTLFPQSIDEHFNLTLQGNLNRQTHQHYFFSFSFFLKSNHLLSITLIMSLLFWKKKN